jgi:phosphate acyltransferase
MTQKFSGRPVLPVAVDAMGGDLGFSVQVEGAVQAYKEYGVHSILVGKENELRGKLASLGAAQLPIQVKHASEVITMDDSPARAVRRKPDSSLCVAYQLVNDGHASAILSSGNSGAMMAAGRMTCGFLPGIERPAIATLLPVAGDRRPNVILDAGANVDCDAQNLVQFALMGSIFYSCLFDIDKPKVSLLSNGSEQSKGTDTVRAAFLLLSKMEGVNFTGYVEGRDVMTDVTDVVVCDGFVGNVLLKTMEGCVRLVFNQLMHDGSKNLFSKLALFLSKNTYKKVFLKKFDYANYGGAPLLGLSKLSIVLHGSSDARAVKNAIRFAHSFAEQGMTEKITSALSQLDEKFTSLDDDLLPHKFFGESKIDKND